MGAGFICIMVLLIKDTKKIIHMIILIGEIYEALQNVFQALFKKEKSHKHISSTN